MPQSRVLRLRGFANHNYGKAFVVRVESRSGKIYTPEHFPGVLEESKCGSGKFSINPVEASFARHDDQAGAAADREKALSPRSAI